MARLMKLKVNNKRKGNAAPKRHKASDKNMVFAGLFVKNIAAAVT